MSDLFPEEFFPIAAGLMGELITVRCVEKVRQIRMFTTICLPAPCSCRSCLLRSQFYSDKPHDRTHSIHCLYAY